jgi:hypothetical protein
LILNNLSAFEIYIVMEERIVDMLYYILYRGVVFIENKINQYLMTNEQNCLYVNLMHNKR